MNNNIFLSYSWKDKDTADEIDNRFKSIGINFIRDVRDAPYKTNLKEFMSRVRDTDYVLMVISDHFLKSANCMYEVMELLTDRSYHERILQVILADADIFNPGYRVNIIKYWQDKKGKLKQDLKGVEIANLGGEAETLKHYTNICINISDFLNRLSNENSHGYSNLVDNKFKPILEFIGYEDNKIVDEILSVYEIEEESERNKVLLKLSFDYSDHYLVYFVNGYYQKDNELAIVYFDQAIKLKPDNAEVYNSRGISYGMLNNDQAAIADFDQAIKLKPDFAEAYTNRGASHTELGKIQAAIADFDQAIKLNPDLAGTYNNRGAIYRVLNKNQTAIADFDQAIKLKPDFAMAYNNRGAAQGELGKNQLAIADFDQAIKLNPDYASAYTNRGVSYRRLNKDQAAIADFDQAIKLNPDFAKAYNNRGVSYNKLNKVQAALAEFDRAIKLKPDYAEAYYNRGVSYRRLNKVQAALVDFDQAIKLNPDFAEAYNNRGASHQELGEIQAAIADFDQAIKLNPDYAEAYYNRGLLFEELGNIKAAKVNYTAILKMRNSPDLISQEVKKRLKEIEILIYNFKKNKIDT